MSAVLDNHGQAGGHAHDDHAHHGDKHGDGTAGYHPHESPLPMLIPPWVPDGAAGAATRTSA